MNVLNMLSICYEHADHIIMTYKEHAEHILRAWWEYAEEMQCSPRAIVSLTKRQKEEEKEDENGGC